MMPTSFAIAGLLMLVALALLIIRSGLPVWALLIGTASAFAVGAWMVGLVEIRVLSAISGRILGLLEHDLLQALPLYVFIGVLLQRLTVADALFSCFARVFRFTGSGTSVAAFGVGALVAPMNGSVASSSALLARLVAPRLGQLDSAASTALVSAASTIGVVVPPSLVLILLGDAMLRAHTEASNLPGYTLGSQRIINTQDVFHAALLPAGCVLLLWLLIAWWQGRRLRTATPGVSLKGEPVKPAQWVVSGLAALAIVALLGGVFAGKIYAVEGAATGAMALLAATLLTRALTPAQWKAVLSDTINLSGALFALLVGANTFSLVFRLWGTDAWITQTVLASPLSAGATSALVLVAVALCAWVLDAFEMIFVVIPIVAPPLIARLGDAQQASVLLLLVLQLSFLIPPMGYAVMMARARSGLAPTSIWRTLRALAPYIAVQCAVTTLVFAVPRMVHLLDAPTPAAAATAVPSEQDIEQQMRDMATEGSAQDEKKP